MALSLSTKQKIALLDSSALRLLLLTKQQKRSSVHEINKRRSTEGEYHNLFNQLKLHPERFYSYTRMSLPTFNSILERYQPRITKSWCNWCNWHDAILPEERLVVTLRFLITGTSFRSLAFSFRMGISTVATIVSETVDIIWQELHELHMKLSETDTVAPFVFVADEAYPLMHCLLKPYGGASLSPEKECFNKRLSRCRKTVECAFGILVSKWRVLNTPIETSADFVDRIIKCLCVLHNVIIDKDGMDHNYTEIHYGDPCVLWDRCGRPSNDARSARDIFTTYLSSQPSLSFSTP